MEVYSTMHFFIFIAGSFQIYVLIVEMTVFVYLFLNYVIAIPNTLQHCVILFIFYISIGEITLYCISRFRYCVLFSRKYFHCRCSRDSSTDYLSCVPFRVLLSAHLQTISALILII